MSPPAEGFDAVGLDVLTLLERGVGPDPLVAVILHDHPGALSNVRRVLRLTPRARVVIIDDGTSDPASVEHLTTVDSGGPVTVVRHDQALGRAACAARAAALAGDSDAGLVVVDSQVEVGPAWLIGLQRVARAGTQVAAVTARHSADVVEFSHLSWSELARAANRIPVAFSVAVDEVPHGAVLFTADGLAAWRKTGSSTLDLPEFCAIAAAAGLTLLSADRVAVRSTSGSTSGSTVEFAESDPTLGASRAVPRRVAYVVPPNDPSAPPDPTREAGRQLSYLQESLRFAVLDDAPGLAVSRLTDRSEQPFCECPGPVTAGSLASWLLRLGVELLHVTDEPNELLDLAIHVAERIGIPRVLTASTHSGDRPGTVPFDAVIALSDEAARVHPDATVVEPGVRVPPPCPLRRGRGRKVGPLRVTALSTEAHDLGPVVSALAAGAGPSVEFHLLGPTRTHLSSGVVAHPTQTAYHRWRVLRDVDPDVALVVPQPGKAVDLVGDMYRALGIPVLILGEGHPASVVRSLGGGAVVDSSEPSDAADLLVTLSRERDRLLELRPDLTLGPILTDRPFIERVRSCYESLLHRAGHRPRLAYLLYGEFGRQDSCGQIRVLTRLAALMPEFVAARQVYQDEILHRNALDEFDTLLVQKRLLGSQAEPVLQAVRASGVRLVVDLDDDLIDDGGAVRSGNMDSRTHQRLRRELTSRLRAAHTVLVSTPTLAERVGPPLSARPPEVVGNDLNPRLWLTAVPARRSPRRRSLRLLYMGTRTHLEDLLLLRTVLDPVAEAIGRPVTLEVVGVADPFEGDEWISRLPVPPRAQPYAEFVQWLRLRRARWDAAVAPLTDCHFNLAKSDLKLLEYAMLDLPVVASDVGPYRGAGGLALLTANDPASWIAALTELLGDLPAAKLRAAAARAHVETNRMMTEDKALNWLGLVTGIPDRANGVA